MSSNRQRFKDLVNWLTEMMHPLMQLLIAAYLVIHAASALFFSGNMHGR